MPPRRQVSGSPARPGRVPAKSIAAAVFRRGSGAASCQPSVANDSYGTCEVPNDSFATLGSTAALRCPAVRTGEPGDALDVVNDSFLSSEVMNESFTTSPVAARHGERTCASGVQAPDFAGP